MKKSIIIITSLLVILGSGYAIYENNKDYIDGNAFHFPYLTDDSVKGFSIAPPWVDNGLIYYLLYKPLIIPSADMTEFKPMLAKSYKVSDDNLSYVFECHDNLKWSDGAPLTIDDIYFSLDFAMKSPYNTPLLQDIFNNIKDIKVDGNTLTINLSHTHATFLLSLSQFLIYPKHIFDKGLENIDLAAFWDNPICSGMFRVAEVNDEFTRLEQNPYFAGQKPKIEEIYLQKDPNAKLDTYFTESISDMVNYRAMRDYTEYSLDISFYRYFVFNMEGNDGYTNPAMQDENTRFAIAVAIDNQQIINSIYLNTISGFRVPDKFAYNSERAKEFISQSNYDLKRPLRLAYYYDDITSRYFVQAIVNNLEEVGFNVELIQGSSADEFINKRNFDVMLKDMMVFSPSDWVLELHSKHSYARVYGGKGEFDALIEQTRREVNPEKQLELIAQLAIEHSEYTYRYPLINLNQAIYLSNRVKLPKGFKFSNPWYMTDLEFEKWEIKKQ